MNRLQEMMRYAVWGVFSMLLNIGMFELLVFCEFDYKVSNIITLITVKAFCYITNKLFVFQSVCSNYKELIKEILSFIAARSASFFLDFIGVIILIEIMKLSMFKSKCIMGILVITMNYVLSKKIIFHK